MKTIIYKYRPNLFSREQTIELNSETISVSVRGKIQATIELDNIKYIRELPGGQGIDPESGEFEFFYCRIVPEQGRAISINSASYLGVGGRYKISAKNLNREYQGLMAELKNRAAVANPATRLVVGSWSVACLWYFVAILSIGLLILGILGAMYSRRPLYESWPIIALCGFGGIIGYGISQAMALSFRPVTSRLVDVIE